MIALNATAKRIAAYVKNHPGETKRAMSIALVIADSTIDTYMGALKAHGFVEADKQFPPRYWPAEAARDFVDEEKARTDNLVAAMHAMVSVGAEHKPGEAIKATALPSRIFRQSMEVNDELEAA